ncbi:MAG: hypothetical protein LBF44_01205 [Holosporaceae bacterium]|jgi:hypothetical protein|nr:hypothetical protein [Holosporaceae bacterium]
MKKILGALAIVCLNCGLSANINVIASSDNFLPNSSDSIIFKVTNKGHEKTQLKVTILRELSSNISDDCANDPNNNNCANEDFCIKGQDIYIAPGNQEEIKLIPFIEEKASSVYKVIFQDSKGNKTILPLTATMPQKKSIELKEIKKDRNGLLKAITK